MKIKEKISKIKLRQLADYQYMYFILLTILFRFMTFSFDNDFWFTINEGRYVINHGFPTKAISSIHDFDFLYQSWGSGTLYYLIYNSLGYFGIFLLLFLVALLTSFFFYKLCFVISNKKKLSLKVTFIFTLLYNCLFLVTRPHIFTVLNLVITLYLLESFIKTPKKKYLFFLPLVSLLEINMHGIYFIVLLIIIIPYLINSFKIKILKSDGYPKLGLFITYCIMILTGFINPYGYKTIIYGFKSYGSSSLFNNSIVELMAPDFHSFTGKIIIISILIVFIIYFTNKEKILLRHYLLLFGTCYLTLDAVKSYYFFLVGGLFPIAYLLKDKKSRLVDKEYSKRYHLSHLALTCIIAVIILTTIEEPMLPKNNNMIDYLDSIVEKKDGIKLFTNYADGSYAEYRGYNCYLDPRGEIFLKQNNHKEDIYQEYHELESLKNDYRDFLKKYQFEYMLLNKDDNIYKLMSKYGYENYDVIKEDDNYQLLALKK